MSEDYDSEHETRSDSIVGRVLFFIAFGTWAAVRILERTYFRDSIQAVIPIVVIRTCCLLVLLAREIVYGKHDMRSLFGFLIAFISACIAFYANHDIYVDAPFFIFAARDIPFKNIALFSVIETTSILLGVVISASTGVIPIGEFATSARGMRLALGFGHPNTVPAFSAYICFLWAYLRGKRFGAIDVIGMLTLEGILYHFTNSRTAPTLVSILVIILLAYRFFPTFFEKSTAIKVLTVGSVFFLAAFTLLASIYFDPNIPWMDSLNSLFSNRLDYSHRALIEFGAPMLGQEVVFGMSSGYSLSTGAWVNRSGQLIVDNMYIRFLVQCGIAFFVGSIAICTETLRQLYRKGEIRLLLIISVAALYSLSEGNCSYLFYNPFLFLLAVPFSDQTFGINH